MPTQAAQTIKYSYDGEQWMTDLRAPLFDNEIRWVPGDTRQSQFYIFNDTDRDGRLTVSIASDNADFSRSLSVSFDRENSAESCSVTAVAVGEKKRIDTVVSMSDAAGNDTRTSSAAIDVVMDWDYRNSAACPKPTVARTNMEGAQP
ncbi:hypothetical protein QM797_25660 [Rhodococcus sp. IEGM 1381]|uniref:hypothetical protein n=1 Tax=Rhodococcus sp. IEGM 1381 TaxID=3047085 RepID=UPI0024B6AB5A|nr:hypothetical protein [Rhodococcus sp. IEGM 1381]MDI9898122.1 hypothetical protein [Rhodococcus sp. IEGM 1381]